MFINHQGHTLELTLYGVFLGVTNTSNEEKISEKCWELDENTEAYTTEKGVKIPLKDFVKLED